MPFPSDHLSPSDSDYAFLADAAASLSEFAGGIAKEIGREHDPAADGKCETILVSMRSFALKLSRVPTEESCFRFEATNERVRSFGDSVRNVHKDVVELAKKLEELCGQVPRNPGTCVDHFVTMMQHLRNHEMDLARHNDVFGE